MLNYNFTGLQRSNRLGRNTFTLDGREGGICVKYSSISSTFSYGIHFLITSNSF